MSFVPVLSSCAVVDHFGPRPNKTLTTLAFSASFDADNTDKPHVSALRKTQSEQLFAEVERLCGTYPDGTSPASCTISTPIQDEPETDPTTQIAASLQELIDAIDQAPAESRPLLIEQAIDLAAVIDPDGTYNHLLEEVDEATAALEVDDKLRGQAEELLKQEYATIYAFDVAESFGAYVDNSPHEMAALQLSALLGDSAPPAPVAYTSDWPTSDTADEFAAHARAAHRAAYVEAAAASSNDTWREWIIRTAATAS